ncbi:MAG: AmmeMemoRadiSam system radical SAM enzyme [Candidatus Woesearchaeota archaeon]
MKQNTRFFHRESETTTKVTCSACAFNCRLEDGQKGLCGVRHNENGTLLNDVYGKVAALDIDPIEKKPFYHFKPGKQALSIGTVGCNFDCDFCQNAGLSKSTKGDVDAMKVIDSSSDDIPPDEVVEICKRRNIPIIAYTYNEPIINVEYILDTAKLARNEGIRNVLVTNGYHSRVSREALAPYIDAVNIDLKAFSKEFYKKRCKASLQPVLDTIEFYHREGVWVEVTTLIIPDENDSDEELAGIASFLAELDPTIPWHVSAFHPHHRMMDHPPATPEHLKKAYRIGKEKGVKHIYLGNVYEPEFASTCCPECGAKVIGRLPQLEGAVDGTCPECGYDVEGVW